MSRVCDWYQIGLDEQVEDVITIMACNFRYYDIIEILSSSYNLAVHANRLADRSVDTGRTRVNLGWYSRAVVRGN